MSKTAALSLVLVCILLKYANDYLVDLIDTNTPITPQRAAAAASGSGAGGVVVFTPDQLNSDKNVLLLALLGKVYDVTKGAKHYGPGGSYQFFVGRDASRAFITGEFSKDLNDNLDGLDDSQIAGLFEWLDFYEKTYTFLGYLNGRFYDKHGQKTAYYKELEVKKGRQAKAQKENKAFTDRFPSCNTEWTQAQGTVKVWCTKESGGVKRNWVGFPRLVYNPNTKSESCACVSESDLSHPSVKPYKKCDPKATTCQNVS